VTIEADTTTKIKGKKIKEIKQSKETYKKK
jgi:hypothetical protein